MDAEGQDCVAEPVGDELGRGQGESVQDDNEFFAAVTAESVVSAQLSAEAVGDRNQHPVTDEVSVGVVDSFEMVEV